jgi:hypothetical protein
MYLCVCICMYVPPFIYMCAYEIFTYLCMHVCMQNPGYLVKRKQGFFRVNKTGIPRATNQGYPGNIIWCESSTMHTYSAFCQRRVTCTGRYKEVAMIDRKWVPCVYTHVCELFDMCACKHDIVHGCSGVPEFVCCVYMHMDNTHTHTHACIRTSHTVTVTAIVVAPPFEGALESRFTVVC